MYDYVTEYFHLIKALDLYDEEGTECDEDWRRIIVNCNFDCDLAIAVVELRLEEIIRIKTIKNNEKDLEFYMGVLRLIDKIYEYKK